MQPGNIVNTVLIVCGALILAAALVGKLIGRRTRNPRRALLGVTVTAIVLNLVWLAAVQPTAARIGPIVTYQALLLGLTLGVVLIGGVVVGAARQAGHKKVLYGASVVTALLAGSGIFAFLLRGNAIMQLASDGGLLQSGHRYEPEKNKDCPENLKSLYIAFSQYAQDWDALPPAANWMKNDDLIPMVSRDEWLHCPAVSDRHDNKYGYAYNDAAAGMKLNGKHSLADLPDAARTPLLYDLSNLDKSAHDALQSLPQPGRHGGDNNILYLDGHVQAVP